MVDVEPKEKAGLSGTDLEAGGGAGPVVEVDPNPKAGAAGGGAELFASALGVVLETCGVEAVELVELLVVPEDAPKEESLPALLSVGKGAPVVGAAAAVSGFPN